MPRRAPRPPFLTPPRPPRPLRSKFKVAVTVPGDNSVDMFTNDLGLVVMTDAAGELEGFNVLVGGGMGRSHGKVGSGSGVE